MTEERSPASDPTNVWDPEVKVEESAYAWRKAPQLLEPLSQREVRGHTLVDLFCGAGGLSQGFQQVGFHIALGVDNHVPSIETFRENHKQATAILGDIRKIPDEMFLEALGDRRVSVLVGGVPCQGFSLSSRKRSKDDERNFLFWEFKRVVDLLTPTYLLLENVTGLKSMANGTFVAAITEALSSAGKGYVVDHRVLNSADYGVPQTRERILFMGAMHGHPLVWPCPSHGSSGGMPQVTVGEALGDLPSLGSGESATEYASDPDSPYQALMRRGSRKVFDHKAPNHPPSTVVRIARTNPGESLYKSFTQRVRLDPDRPSPTIVAGGIRPQFHHGHPWDSRGLTVRERARIMSFPDRFRFPVGVVMGRVLTGQAVPPLLATALARGIQTGLVGRRFGVDLMAWFGKNRREYPWRKRDLTPFQVLVAEVLLRKTRADAVVPVWSDLVERYPDSETLALAETKEVEEIIHGIGLSRLRAEALVSISDTITRRWLGSVPADYDALLELPEVGPYIANAILCFAFGEKRPILDANVHRIFNRLLGMRPARELHKAKEHWSLAHSLLPEEGYRDYNLALLDFGAVICQARKPRCDSCFAVRYCEHLVPSGTGSRRTNGFSEVLRCR